MPRNPGYLLLLESAMVSPEELREKAKLLLEEMRHTNTRRGLKPVVQDDWCCRLAEICRCLDTLCREEVLTSEASME